MNIDDIKTIGVLGGGLMGQGISQSAILAGYKVICRDLTDEIVAKTHGQHCQRTIRPGRRCPAGQTDPGAGRSRPGL